jgi:PAS domain S-box-containing protein
MSKRNQPDLKTDNPEKQTDFKSELENYKKRISNILESFTDGFFEVDSQWTVTYWNKEAENLLLMSREQILGRNLWKVYQDAVSLKFYTEYHKAMKENVSVRFEEYFPQKNAWFEVAAFPSGNGLSVYFKDITSKKNAVDQLKMEKERYSELFNLSPLPQWVYDYDTLNFLDVNVAAVKHYGFSRTEFLHMTIMDIRPKDDLDALSQILQNDVKLGVFNKSLVRHQKKNGEIRLVKVEGNSVSFEGKNARLVLALDCTEQIAAQHALSQSEQRFKALVQDGSDLITILDNFGNCKYISPTSISILNIEPSLLIGKNAFEFIHPDDRAKVITQFQSLKEKKRIKLLPFRLAHSNKQYKWIETILTDMSGDNNIGGIVANSRDITANILNKLKMEESVERYNIVSKATSDAIWDWDMQTEKMTWNMGIKGIFGHKDITYTEAWRQSHIHPDDLPKVLAKFQHTLKNGKSRLTTEYRFRCANGNYKTVLDRAFIIFDTHNKPIRAIGSMQDISRQIKYIDDIKQQNKQLREISWIQSHAVRAPLAKILGIVNLLHDTELEKKDQDRLLNYLNLSAQTLDGVIHEIIKKAR